MVEPSSNSFSQTESGTKVWQTHRNISLLVGHDVIECDLSVPVYNNPSAIVVIVHGFQGFKDWGFFPYVRDWFARNGMAALTFNFSHNGYRIGSDRIERPDMFRANTISRERSELRSLVNAIQTRSIDDPFFTSAEFSGKIHLLGHSRGGGLVVLCSNELHNPDSRIVAWCPVSTYLRYTERQIDFWRKNGYLKITNSRTKQDLEMGIGLLDDLLANPSEHDVLEAARRTEHPIMVIHGEQDITVPASESKLIAEQSERISYVPIPTAGHTFNVSHPMNEPSSELRFVLQQSLNFLLSV